MDPTLSSGGPEFDQLLNSLIQANQNNMAVPTPPTALPINGPNSISINQATTFSQANQRPKMERQPSDSIIPVEVSEVTQTPENLTAAVMPQPAIPPSRPTTATGISSDSPTGASSLNGHPTLRRQDTDSHAGTPVNRNTLVRTPSVPANQVSILFSHPQTGEEEMIQSKLVARIPEGALSLMKSSGTYWEGSKGYLDMGPASYHTMTRLKQYLEHGDYTPFDPKTTLTVVDGAGTVCEWRKGIRAVQTSQETHELFWYELILYRRAVQLQYDEIRQLSSLHIRSSYPIYLQEVITMIERLYSPASKAKDTTLLEFIKDQTERYADQLLGHPRFQELLQSSIVDDSPGRLLLGLYFKANNKPKLDLKMNPPSVPAAHTQRQLQTPVSATSKDGMSLKSDPSTVGSPKSPNPTPSELLRKVAEAIIDGRLLVARNDGYGTLINPSGKRNRDFKFARSELLLADFDVPQTRHNMVVINSRGQRGDVLESFMQRYTASGLGIEGEPVHCGNDDRLDREQRTFNHSGKRERSRSPSRVPLEYSRFG